MVEYVVYFVYFVYSVYFVYFGMVEYSTFCTFCIAVYIELGSLSHHLITSQTPFFLGVFTIIHDQSSSFITKRQKITCWS